MWIQLLLPVEMPLAKKTKKKCARKATKVCKEWVQIEIKLTLKELAAYSPSLMIKAWNWIKEQAKNLTSSIINKIYAIG